MITVIPATASQTIGPFWHALADGALTEGALTGGALTGGALADLTRFGATGERIVLVGTVTDGDGAAVTDACVELWQASPPASTGFSGFGRCATDAQGGYRFTTLRPAPLPGRGNQTQAPHLALTIFARGLLSQLVTRAYFAGEALNATDPVLNAVPAERRATLIAEPTAPGTWRLDIRLQGEAETVFLDV
jgi:protocatechuate 3,4-dioxygenase alpha subunit